MGGGGVIPSAAAAVAEDRGGAGGVREAPAAGQDQAQPGPTTHHASLFLSLNMLINPKLGERPEKYNLAGEELTWTTEAISLARLPPF